MLERVHEEETIWDEASVEATARKVKYKEFRRCYDISLEANI